MAAVSGTVLVTTASGQVGSAVVVHLLSKGVKVRAAMRNKEGNVAKAATERGAEVVEVNFEDQDSLDAAAKGCEAAVFVSPFCDEHQDVTEQWLKAFEANKDGLKHIVRLSCMGADDPQTLVQRWHALDEVLTRATDIPTTTLRPTYFLEYILMFSASIKASGGKHVHCMGDAGVSYVGTADIARVVAAVLEDPGKYADQSIDLHGPRAVSMDEVCAMIGEASGKPVEYVHISPQNYKAGLGKFLTELMADNIVETIEYAAGGKTGFNKASNIVEEITGSPAEDPADFIKKNADAYFK